MDVGDAKARIIETNGKAQTKENVAKLKKRSSIVNSKYRDKENRREKMQNMEEKSIWLSYNLQFINYYFQSNQYGTYSICTSCRILLLQESFDNTRIQKNIILSCH